MGRSLEHTRLSHPSSVLKSMLEGAGEDLLIDKFEEQLVEFYKKNIFSGSFLSSISGCPKVIDLYIEEAKEKAGSSDFDTANHFSRNIKDVDIYLSKCLSGKMAFLLIANILRAADCGAWGAQALRNVKFSSIPRIKELVIEYVNSENVASREIYKEVTGDAKEFDNVVAEYILSEVA